MVTQEAETVIINNEEVEVWPASCPRSNRNCSACYFEGKIRCNPSYKVETAEAPPPPSEVPPEPVQEAPSLPGVSPELTAVPPRPKKRKKLWQYFEENKTAIIADYQHLPLRDFLDRWRISTLTWRNLKTRCRVEGKLAGTLRFKPELSQQERDEIGRDAKEKGVYIVAQERNLSQNLVKSLLMVHSRKLKGQKAAQPQARDYEKLYKELLIYHRGYRRAVLDGRR